MVYFTLLMIRYKLVQLGLYLVGYVAPAYNNYKAILREDAPTTKYWATYWVIFAFFVSLEWAIDLVISWVPFYYEIKLLFVLALWHPRFQVAQYLFQHGLAPFLANYERDIDRFLQETKAKLGDAVNHHLSRQKDMVKQAAAFAGDKISQVQAKASERAQQAKVRASEPVVTGPTTAAPAGAGYRAHTE